MSSPYVRRTLLRIVIGEIVIGKFNFKSLVNVAEIFLGKCVEIVFGMAGYEKHTRIFSGDDIRAGNVASCDKLKLLNLGDLRFGNPRMSGMRCLEYLVKAAYDRVIWTKGIVVENTEHFAL